MSGSWNDNLGPIFPSPPTYRWTPSDVQETENPVIYGLTPCLIFETLFYALLFWTFNFPILRFMSTVYYFISVFNGKLCLFHRSLKWRRLAIPLFQFLKSVYRRKQLMVAIVQFRVRCDHWIKEVKTHFFIGLASMWSKYILQRKKDLFISLSVRIFKFQTLTCRNFWIYFTLCRG